MYQLPKITEVFIKEFSFGYGICGKLENGSPILLDWFYENESLALRGMKYIKENVLERIEDNVHTNK